MRRFYKQAAALFVLGAIMTPVWAHHSTAAYDFEKNLTLTGTVRTFRWTNPHNYLQLVVVGKDGVKREWALEAGTPATATKMGWTKNTVKPGDRVTAVVAPMRDGSPAGSIKNLRLPNGQILQSVAGDPKASEVFKAIPRVNRVPEGK